jgi:hypothetical protein
LPHGEQGTSLHDSNFSNKKVVFIGPIDEKDFHYFDKLKTIGQRLNVEIEFQNSVPRKLVPNILYKYGIFYTGTPGSTDKAAIDVRDLLGINRYLHMDNCQPHRVVSNVHGFPLLLILKETLGVDPTHSFLDR